MNTVILGSGIAGISAGYHLKQKGIPSIIYEKDSDWGGLCNSFVVDGFRFDRFVHFSFAPNEKEQKLFAGTTGMHDHKPISSNYYHGNWLRHPTQNNLAPLPSSEKVKIIYDFINRHCQDINTITNYEQWLRVQYGNYFAENFPFAYTRKYWGVEPCELETEWVGSRMHIPDIKQVLAGAFETQDEIFYYAKTMRYPKQGGFRSILNTCRNGLDIRLNKKAISINPKTKTVFFADNTKVDYMRLISTMPLPLIIKALPNVPDNVKQAAKKLRHTCGYQVSLGFNRADIAKHLWFYIYDEDILPSRIYSPSLKSADNAPNGCSSLQAEIFFDNLANIPRPSDVLQNTIEKLIKMNIFKEEDLIVQDIRFEPYANITFVPSIYKNRQTVLDYLKNLNIESIGRFGKWEYAWTYQAFEHGKNL